MGTEDVWVVYWATNIVYPCVTIEKIVFFYNMLQNDSWIIGNAELGMISPFEPSQIRQVAEPWNRKVISYGVSSYGYDIRLSAKEFFVFRHVPGQIVNPKRFQDRQLETVELQHDEDGDFFVIPGNSYGLGVSLERLNIPPDITVLCVGKSTYARCGIIANVTPAEASWIGYLTLEFSNASSADCRVYANEGIVQLLFLKGNPCETTYADRDGKYQGQVESVVLPKV